MTLVDYICKLLIPYADMPEFATCVMKAMEKLKHPISGKSMYQKPFKSCLINDTTQEKDLWSECDE